MLKFRGHQITASATSPASEIIGYEEVTQRYRGQTRVLRLPVYGTRVPAPVSHEPGVDTLLASAGQSGLGMDVEIIDTQHHAGEVYFVGQLGTGKRLLLRSQAGLYLGKTVFAKIHFHALDSLVGAYVGVAEPYAFALA